MKRNLLCFVIAIMLLLFTLPTIAETRFNEDAYSGSCSNYFTCDRKWNMINDNTLRDNNSYAKLGSTSGNKAWYNSRLRIVLSSSGLPVYDDLPVYSGGQHIWKNTQGYQGKCSLQIFNSYNAGSTLYAGGNFAIYHS